MLKTGSREAIGIVSRFLDSCGFHCASSQVGAEDAAQIFPPFSGLQEFLRRSSDLHRFLFTLLRQGHVATPENLRAHLPPEVIAALSEVGLLVQNRWGESHTPSLAIASVHGVKLVVSLPVAYPTTTRPEQPLYIGPETLLNVSCLPATLRGKSVLELGGGNGLLGLLCAARGARRVVSRGHSPETANAMRFNAVLNGLDRRVEVYEPLGSPPGADESFDFVVVGQCMFPAPEEASISPWAAWGPDGSAALRPLLEQLCTSMGSVFSGIMGCHGLGDSHSVFINREIKQLALSEGFHVRAIVCQKQSLDEYRVSRLDPVLRGSCAQQSADERAALSRRWVETRTHGGASHVYVQVLRFERPSAKPGLSHAALYPPQRSDPLVSLVSRHRAFA